MNDLIKRLLSLGGHDGLVPRGLQPVLEHHDDVGIIVDNKNFGVHRNNSLPLVIAAVMDGSARESYCG